MIIQGTTPAIVLSVKDGSTGEPYALDDCEKITLAITDGRHTVRIDKSQMAIDGGTITAVMTQRQTMALDTGEVKVQLKACISTSVIATLEATTSIYEIIDRVVM